MKIALIHYSAPPVVGGVESVMAHHARLMADAGHQVQLIAGRGAQGDPRVDLTTLPLIDSRHPRVLSVKDALDAGQVPADFEPLVDEIRRDLTAALDGVDLVIAHNVCSLHKNLALTAALYEIYQAPIITHQLPIANSLSPHRFRLLLWHHDLAWTAPHYRAELHEGFPWDLLRRDWPGARQIVVSELRRTELARLIGRSPESIAVVPSGVDAAAFLNLQPLTRQLTSELKLLDAAPLLLLPVRLTPRKNIELALRALAVLRQTEFPEAALVVTGPPGPHNPANLEYFAALKALRTELGLEQAAHFLAEQVEGYLPDEVIADFYRLADALFMPSRMEGFGIPLIEAGLAHLPAFCADIPPLRDLGGAEATYFSPEADPGEVAALIAERLGKDAVFKAAVRVRRGYLWERVYADRIAPLLQP